MCLQVWDPFSVTLQNTLCARSTWHLPTWPLKTANSSLVLLLFFLLPGLFCFFPLLLSLLYPQHSHYHHQTSSSLGQCP